MRVLLCAAMTLIVLLLLALGHATYSIPRLAHAVADPVATEVMSADDSLRVARETGTDFWRCDAHGRVPIAGDAQHVIRRSETNAHWVVRHR